MRHLVADLRFTLRLFRRTPLFFLTVLSILVLGIGATTAMFSLVESLLLKPLAFERPEELTVLWETTPRSSDGNVSLPNFLDWRAQATTYAAMAGVESMRVSLSSEGARAQSLPGAGVTGDFFAVMGGRPLRGRLLGPDDDRLGGARVAVVSAAIWHERFGSDPDIVGRTVTLNSDAYTVVGVAPEGFRFGSPQSDRVDVWMPLAVSLPDYRTLVDERGWHFLMVLGRMKPGVTVDRARAQLASIAQGLEVTHRGSNFKRGAHVEDLKDALVGSSRTGVWVVFAAVLLVLVIVCANVATLLLARAQSRRAEMAARAALGATSARLAAQVVTETLVLFLVAGLGGAMLARLLVDALRSGLVDSGALAVIDVSVDGGALAFTIATCVVCGLVFGLMPALAVARTAPHTILQEGGTRASLGGAQKTLRGALVVAQVALACALLVGSGLALRAFARLAATPPGFDPDDVATCAFTPPLSKYGDDARRALFYREVLAKVAALPGVVSAAGDDTLPMGGSNSQGTFKIEGRGPWPLGDEPSLRRNVASAGYFKTMAIPILRGRDFTDADAMGGRAVMIISQAAADRFFPGQDPIGKRIDPEDETQGGGSWHEIIGVVGDVRPRGLAAPIVPEAYFPLAQVSPRQLYLVVRSPRAREILNELPAVVASVDPELAVSSRRLLKDRVADSISARRYVALLLAAFGAAALVLATVGIFGLVSYSTGQRTREIGIRMALGSTPEAALILVVKGAVLLVASGIGAGLVGSLWVGHVLAARIAGVSAFDPAIYALIPLVLGAAGVLACLAPAWRAVRIPPASALRYE